ncbi:4'-phosphopantetheinyl transferase family protein [Flavobacterium notoginsengisoli]|uniref:4'-phosphopantetheinyl transferase family protein n=1 Tax=Flavobacterium notoginsengisoli TaxID=1478199 RepID=UPI003638F71F
MIHIFYTRFNTQIPSEVWNSFYKHLPLEIIERAKKYRKWEDHHAFLLGRLLLIEAFGKIGLEKKTISDIRYNKFGRPFLDDSIDFNISHSGKFVVCAIGKGIKLGIDIETIVDVDFSDFKDVMTFEQWKVILESDNPKKTFFKMWTIKESVIKAEAKGMSIPLLNITIKKNEAGYDNQIWHLKEFNLDEGICLCLASNIIATDLQFYEIDYYSQLKDE